MRVEKGNPRQKYDDYWDWLRTGWNPVWVMSLFVGYIYYLMTTEEV